MLREEKTAVKGLSKEEIQEILAKAGVHGKKERPLNSELRSEEIQDILSRPPRWMIRWGNSVLILIIVLGLTLSYFIKYPDVIPGKAVISTKTPPVYISSKVSGRIESLIVENGTLITKGDIIAEIDNPVSPVTIEQLSLFLNQTHKSLQTTSFDLSPPPTLNLFEAGTNYINLTNALRRYKRTLGNQGRKLELLNLKNKRANQIKVKEVTLKEIEFNKADIDYAKEKFAMQEKEYKMGYTSKLDFLNSKSVYNQSLKAQETIKKSILQLDMVIADYDTQIRQLEKTLQEEEQQQLAEVVNMMGSLQNFIVAWKNDYAITAPTSGRLDYLRRVKKNQMVEPGDDLFAIVPEEDEYEVELETAPAGFGKVKVGQQVKLKLDNFPYHEFGFVNARVKRLPALPTNEGYKIALTLDQGLNTSYDIQVKYSPEMTASAEIITEDLRLIERIMYQIIKIF